MIKKAKITKFERRIEEINRDLVFKPTFHQYFYKGKKLKSVTSHISEFFKDFDADFWAERKAKNSELSPEEIKKGWKDKADTSIQLGNKVHALADNYLKGVIYSSSDPYLQIIKSALKEFEHLKVVDSEMIIAYPQVGLAGTIDLLMHDKQGNYYIMDWKSNAKIKFDKYQKGLPPLHNLDDNNFTHYALQLNTYRWILEKNYGIKVNELFLIHVQLEGHTIYKCPDLSKHIKNIILQKKLPKVKPND